MQLEVQLKIGRERKPLLLQGVPSRRSRIHNPQVQDSRQCSLIRRVTATNVRPVCRTGAVWGFDLRRVGHDHRRERSVARESVVLRSASQFRRPYESICYLRPVCRSSARNVDRLTFGGFVDVLLAEASQRVSRSCKQYAQRPVRATSLLS